MTQLIIIIIAGAIVCALVVAIYRVRNTAQWRAERRTIERRDDSRRSADDRRNEVRQRHDDLHNSDRRTDERREDERRDGEDWEEEYVDLKNRLEKKQRDNRNV